MGAVYRARDPRMGREVAIKVAAEAFGDRLSREVHAIASLNHPNICTIHDVGPDFIVMELVEGRTLAAVIGDGPLPVNAAITIARKIAGALEAAHDKGIVHRDLKPANVIVSGDAAVKVLDFGLAAVTPGSTPASGSGAPSHDNLSHSPTMLASVPGMILGTAAYMAPEQARGKVVDRRADIWAFGCVLYEMLAGKRAFQGEEVTDTLAFIITKEPDWQALPGTTPSAIRRLLRRCLRKNPVERLHDIADARIEIDEAMAEPEIASSPVAPARSAGWRVAVPWSVAALAAIAAVAAIAMKPRAILAPGMPLTHFTIPLPPGSTPVEGGIAVAPTGSAVAFVAGPTRQIFVRPMNQIESKALAGTDGATFLSFSPDGRWISYVDGGLPSQLRKISIDGGASQVLAEASTAVGPPVQTWAADNSILFSNKGVLMRLPPSGTTPQTLATPDAKDGARYYYALQLLPGGQALVASSKGLIALDPADAEAEDGFRASRHGSNRSEPRFTSRARRLLRSHRRVVGGGALRCGRARVQGVARDGTGKGAERHRSLRLVRGVRQRRPRVRAWRVRPPAALGDGMG